MDVPTSVDQNTLSDDEFQVVVEACNKNVTNVCDALFCHLRRKYPGREAMIDSTHAQLLMILFALRNSAFQDLGRSKEEGEEWRDGLNPEN